MAGDTIDNIAQQQFEDEFHEAYQQKRSMFEGMSRTRMLPSGKSDNFPIESAADDPVARGGRHSNLQNTEGDESNINIPVTVYRGRWDIDEEDEWLTRADVRQAKINAQIYAAQRKRDKLFVAAAELGVTEIGDATAALSLAQIQEAAEYAMANEWPEGEAYFAVSPRGLTQIQNLASTAGNFQVYTSRDFGPGTALVNPMRVFDWFGFHFVVSNRLSRNTATGRRGLIWTKSAIGTVIQREPTAALAFLEESRTWMGSVTMSMGVKTIDAVGVRAVSYLES